jgi:hypothetical protein
MRTLMRPGAGACLRASYQQGMRSHGFDLFADVVHMDIQPGWVSSAELQSVGPLARGITPHNSGSHAALQHK